MRHSVALTRSTESYLDQKSTIRLVDAHTVKVQYAIITGVELRSVASGDVLLRPAIAHPCHMEWCKAQPVSHRT